MILCPYPTPQSRVLPEKLTVPRLVKKLSEFYETRRLIIVFKTARHLLLSWARLIQLMPSRPKSLKFVLILPFQHTPRYSNWPLSFFSPPKHPTRATCPAYLSLYSIVIYEIKFVNTQTINVAYHSPVLIITQTSSMWLPSSQIVHRKSA